MTTTIRPMTRAATTAIIIKERNGAHSNGRGGGGRRQAGLDDASFTPGVIGDTEVVAGAADGIRSTGLVSSGEQAQNQGHAGQGEYLLLLPLCLCLTAGDGVPRTLSYKVVENSYSEKVKKSGAEMPSSLPRPTGYFFFGVLPLRCLA